MAREDALLLVLERGDYERVKAHGFDGQLKGKADAIARAPVLVGCLPVGARWLLAWRRACSVLLCSAQRTPRPKTHAVILPKRCI